MLFEISKLFFLVWAPAINAVKIKKNRIMEAQNQNISGTPSEKKKNDWLKGLTIAGYVCSGVAVTGFIVLVCAVIGDWDKGVEIITLPIIFLSLIMSVVGIIASLFGKRWLLAGGGCGCLVATLAIGFISAILVAVGQHHPPQRDDVDTIDTCIVEEDEWDTCMVVEEKWDTEEQN